MFNRFHDIFQMAVDGANDFTTFNIELASEFDIIHDAFLIHASLHVEWADAFLFVFVIFHFVFLSAPRSALRLFEINIFCGAL